MLPLRLRLRAGFQSQFQFAFGVGSFEVSVFAQTNEGEGFCVERGKMRMSGKDKVNYKWSGRVTKWMEETNTHTIPDELAKLDGFFDVRGVCEVFIF